MSIARARGGWRVVVSAVVAAFSAAAHGQVKEPPSERLVDLRPRFETGQTVKLKMEVTNTSTPVVGKTPPSAPATPPKTPGTKPGPGSPPPGSEDLRSAIQFGLTMKVKSVSRDHVATVDLTFDTVKVSTKNKDQSFDFDSSKPSKGGDDEVMGMVMQPLVGSTLTLTVDRSGTITSVTGGEAFSALGQFVGGTGGGGGGNAGSLFGPLFSPQHGTGLVHVGETWENSDKVESPLLGQFAMKTRHTLRSATAAEAKVDVSGRIDPATEASGPAGSDPFQIKESRYGGTYLWDLSMGMLKQMDTTMSVTMEQTVAGQKTTSHNESVMKVTRIK
jgi:hypothetical protein